MIVTRLKCDLCRVVSGPVDLTAPSPLPAGWGAGVAWADNHYEHLCAGCMICLTADREERRALADG